VSELIGLDAVESANRRLAHLLGGDPACTDAARILRPAGTLNYKHAPPAAVELVGYAPDLVYPLDALTEGLHDPADDEPARRTPVVHSLNAYREAAAAGQDLHHRLRGLPTSYYVERLTGQTPGRDGKVRCPFHHISVGEATAGGVLPARSLADASSSDRVSPDPLLLVPPPVYFERLTGLRVGRSGKLRCLFHDDQHPSLHVYPEAGRGWYCFGCGRGGSVYDLAALLSGRTTRGADFFELRSELEKLLL
jgi:hypothetical protein